MLWFKGWLETRPRVAILSCLVAFVLARAWMKGTDSLPASAPLNGVLSIIWVGFAVMLAGDGIRTQSGSISQTSKGLVGSTHFTLSLPVSRFMLVATRTAVGLGQMLVLMTIAFCAAWVFVPAFHARTTLAEAVEYGAATFACTLSFYFISTIASVFLDYTWQIFGSLIAIFSLRWLAGVAPPPRAVDFFGCSETDRH